jgi:hypothetical protein
MNVQKRVGMTLYSIAITGILILTIALLTQSNTVMATPYISNNIPFLEHEITNSFAHARSVYAVDLDNDSDVDILGAAVFAGSVAWWENDGNQNFTMHVITSSFSDASSVYAIDLDNDNDIDVLGAASHADDITWWENDGNENFTEHTIDGSFNGASAIYAFDVNGDGNLDVLGAGWLADDIAWWENDGNENFTKHVVDGSFDGATSVFACDIDNDNDIDILGAAFYADDITWWENDGNENFTEHTVAGNFDWAVSVYAEDVDADGDVDILGAAKRDGIKWWENNGDENFTEHTIVIDNDFTGATSVYVVDVNGDGHKDVLGAANYNNHISWWENNGSGNFTEYTIDSNFYGAADVFAVDLDGDGDQDILGAAEEDNAIVWWEQNALSPISPSNVVATTVSRTQIDLTWQDNSIDESSFYIEKSLDGANWTFTDTVAANVTSYSDISLECETLYYYRILAYRNDGQYSSPSPVASAQTEMCPRLVYLPTVLNNFSTTPPSYPPILHPISNEDGDNSYSISWTAVERATSYVLEEDTNNSFTNPEIVYSNTLTTTSITVENTGMYYYRVRSVNNYGSSDWSNIVATEVVNVGVVPEPGYYSGTSPTIHFDVTSTHQVCDLFIRTPLYIGAYCEIDLSECVDIVSGEFEFSRAETGAVFTISGHFDSETTSIGNYTVIWCESVAGRWEGDWDASKR